MTFFQSSDPPRQATPGEWMILATPLLQPQHLLSAPAPAPVPAPVLGGPVIGTPAPAPVELGAPVIGGPAPALGSRVIGSPAPARASGSLVISGLAHVELGTPVLSAPVLGSPAPVELGLPIIGSPAPAPGPPGGLGRDPSQESACEEVMEDDMEEEEHVDACEHSWHSREEPCVLVMSFHM